MGVRILYDSKNDIAALYCSTSDVAFGPVFTDGEKWDADERAEAFTRWLKQDARRYDDAELMRLYGEWLAQEVAQFNREEAEAAVAAAMRALYENCLTCDGYVLNPSEAPYCPSCARERETQATAYKQAKERDTIGRERRRLLDLIRDNLMATKPYPDFPSEQTVAVKIAAEALQDAHAFYQPDQWPTSVLRVSDRPGAGVTAYWLRLKLKSSGDRIETWFSSMTERNLFVLSMGQWADVDQEWMS